MSAMVAERPIQPWKPKSRQRVQEAVPADDASTGNGQTTEAREETPSPRAALTTKHPLQNRWSMWYYKNDKSKDWKMNLKLVASCDTVEVRWNKIGTDLLEF